MVKEVRAITTAITTDTLTAEVLDEVECIVRAEWVRLLTASIPEHDDTVRTEMPAPRPRPPKLAIRSARPERRGAPAPGSPRNRSDTRRRNRRVWPTQRSPPGRHRSLSARQWEVMVSGDEHQRSVTWVSPTAT